MTVLVTGARGRVGRAVLDGLLAAGLPAGELRASGRDASLLDLPAGVAAVSADLGDPAGLAAALEGVDQAFLYATAGDPALLADALDAAGTVHAVLLSSASVHLDDAASDPIAAHHLGAERALAAARADVTALRPGAFASNALAWASGVRTAGRVELARPGAHTTPIHERDIADAAVAALTTGVGRGAPVELSGPESLTFSDQVAILAAELGRPLELVELTDEQARAAMSAHVPTEVVDALLRLWAASDGVPEPVHDVVAVTGRPGRSFATWAHDHRTAFGG